MTIYGVDSGTTTRLPVNGVYRNFPPDTSQPTTGPASVRQMRMSASKS